MCFMHDGNSPTELIKINTCNAHFVNYAELSADNLCEFDMLSGKYAWVNETTQHLKSDNVYGDKF